MEDLTFDGRCDTQGKLLVSLTKRPLDYPGIRSVADLRVALSRCRYGVAMDVKRAADLYAQGRTLRQIGAELGVTATTASDQYLPERLVVVACGARESAQLQLLGSTLAKAWP